MNQTLTIRKEIVDELNALPLEVLPELRTFMRFLQFKRAKTHNKSITSSQQMQWQSALETTFGMWADRSDIVVDGVAYVQNIRRGHRLDDFLERVDEAD